MSRIISDEGLMTWEVFASTGAFGLPQQPKIVFHCLSDPHRRPRYILHDGDNATAIGAVQSAGEDELRRLLAASQELD
jgi:hypothetical protein